jgi:4,5-DOPA dioxygenase extradiol
MDRSRFLQSLAVLPLIGISMKLQALGKLVQPMKTTGKMPVLFVGHGSPMNAIEENEFVKGFRQIGREIETPSAILCISAHWETRGTYVTAMPNPRTIHDFGGFPKELYEVQYPAPGDPALARQTQQMITGTSVQLDEHWGLDHGAWSVIKHLYPKANIPVIQMSLDTRKSPTAHYELAKELARLRRKGVLIIGSGNMVHNLRLVAWDRLNESGYGFDWAIEASEKMKTCIQNGDHNPLIQYGKQGKAFNLAIPTPDHFLPLLYTLALQEGNEEISLFNDKAIAGSLTMTSVKIGA